MDYRRPLVWHGVALFLVGLLTGLAESHFANTRMGLAAHLEGVMNGTFLLAVGAIWGEVRLSPRTKTWAYWMLLGGTYGNWVATTAAAVLGAVALSPIAGAGYSASPPVEAFVTGGFVVIGILIILAAGLLLWGLRKSAT